MRGVVTLFAPQYHITCSVRENGWKVVFYCLECVWLVPLIVDACLDYMCCDLLAAVLKLHRVVPFESARVASGVKNVPVWTGLVDCNYHVLHHLHLDAMCAKTFFFGFRFYYPGSVQSLVAVISSAAVAVASLVNASQLQSRKSLDRVVFVNSLHLRST